MAQQRATLLREIIRSRPHAALEAALSAEQRDRLLERHPALAPYLELPAKLAGPVEVLVSDDFARARSWQEIRLPRGAAWLRVSLASPPERLASGDLLALEGIRLGEDVAAAQATILTASPPPDCPTTGEQKAVVLLVTLPSVSPPPLTAADFQQAFFSSSAPSLPHFLQEASHAKTSLRGDVFGWFTLNRLYTCEETSELRAAAIAAADAVVDFRNYSRVVIVFPKPNAACEFAGKATLGCRDLSSPDGAFVASTSWLVADYLTTRETIARLASHEIGHNLGLSHASRRAFPACRWAFPAFWATTPNTTTPSASWATPATATSTPARSR